MITSVFVSFFDSTPSSQILNRSSTDQSKMDKCIVAWQVFGISIWYQAYYISTARELARMVGIRKALILHHFSESISGAATICCFNQEDRFLRRSLSIIDDYSRIAFHNYGTMKWLSVRTNFLFNIVFFLVLIILVTLPRSAIYPSLAGLVATYGLNLNVLQAWVIWNLCNVENKMISVERILQFTKLPCKAPLVIEECMPDSDWPTNGSIQLENVQLIGVFVLLSDGSSAFILGRAVLLSTIAIKTAQHLFNDMITSVFRAPISFFDSTPSSQILNRSSTDQSTVDTDVPYRLAGLVFALIQLLSIIFLMSQVAWQVFPFFLVAIGISIWYQAYYISTARELARMVGIRKAPILHHFSESISGAATIRCFNQEDRFLRRSLCVIDDYSRKAFNNYGTMEWLSVRTNFLFNIVFFLVPIILVTLPRSAIYPSLAGLVATYGLNLNVLQAWVIWNLCNVENKMISVERIHQFTKLPCEAPAVIKGCRPDSDWPTNGSIQLENVHVRYTPALPMVLKGITCTFPGEKKIGVVGRTGSRKSTLIQALFRVVEPSIGRIVIDGVDISKIGLQDLRSRLGIIPQDPTLFQVTVRTNLVLTNISINESKIVEYDSPGKLLEDNTS